MPFIRLSSICLIHNHVNDRGGEGGSGGKLGIIDCFIFNFPHLLYIRGSQSVGPGPQGGLKPLKLNFFWGGGGDGRRVSQNFIVEKRMCEGLA